MKNLIYKTSFILAALTIVVGISYAESAWVDNNSIPTANNTETLLNVGNVSQTKQGTLTLSELSANVVNSPEFCLYPDNCVDTWPSTSGSLTGSGSVNYLAKWDTTTSLTNSQIYENGTNIGIKETNPNYKIDVNGDVNGNRICINGDCRSNWPTDSGGNNCYTANGRTISNGGLCVRETTATDNNFYRVYGYTLTYVHFNICQNGNLVDAQGSMDLGYTNLKGNKDGNDPVDIVYCSNI